LDDAFFWGGCEHKAFSAIYRNLLKDVQLSRERFVLYSHWHKSLCEEQIIAQGGEAYLPQQATTVDLQQSPETEPSLALKASIGPTRMIDVTALGKAR